MPLVNQPILPTSGIDRSLAPLLSDKGSFYTLRNLRHSFQVKGVIEQTPYWYAYSSFARGTYYNAGSLTEPATSAVRLLTKDLVVTDYVCRSVSGQMQVFYQTTVPAAESLTTGCRIVINDVTSLGITLGSTFEIKIVTDDHHFQWRKNGGAWSVDTAITTSGVSVDSGHVTVYFLTATGFDFATPSQWAWTRTDASFANASGSFDYPSVSEYYKNELYYNSVDDRAMLCTRATTSSELYCISVGYRPVVGGQMKFFDDHLVLGQADKNTSGWLSPGSRYSTVMWSDKTDVHNFIPTDTNEADQYRLPDNHQFDTVLANQETIIQGFTVIQDQLYLFTNYEVYSTISYGLPLVFSWKKLFNLTLAATLQPVIQAEQGCFLVGYNEMYHFDGSALKAIAGQVLDGTPNFNFVDAIGVWDFHREELNICLYDLLYVWQKKWNTWYVRQVDFSSDNFPVTCISSWSGRIAVGGVSLKTYREDTTATSQPVYDNTNGTAYSAPYLITQPLGRDLATVKEIECAYLGAIVNATGVSATYYTTGNSISVQLGYWLLPGGDFINVTEVQPSGATWSAANSDGLIGFPKIDFRAIALSFQVNGTVSKPAAFITINTIVPRIYNAEERAIEK